MLKRICLLLVIITLLPACKDNSSDPQESPLIGTWALTTMKYNNAEVNPDNYTNVPVRFLFSFTGSGTVWYETSGKSNGSAGFLWSTSGSNLTSQAPESAAKTVSFSVNGNQLTITDTENYQYIYTKEN